MHVAHFCQRYPPAPGGSEACFARLSEHLAQRGHEMHVYTSNADELEAFWTRKARTLPEGDSIQNGVHVHRFPLRHYPGHRYVMKLLSLVPFQSWKCRYASYNPILPAMWKMAHSSMPKFDVIHATAFPYGWPLICAQRLATRQRAPFVLTPFVHTGDPGDPHDRTRRGYTKSNLVSLAHAADRVFVQTDVEREVLHQCGIPREKMILQGMGVDELTCTGGNRAQARKQWQIGETEVIVGHLANKSWEKGTNDLLEASARAWQSGAQFRVMLAGPEMSNFREFWQRFPMKSRVIHLNWLTEKEKRDFFAAIDIHALPSRSDSFGIVLLEAWLNNVPNIAYRAGGVASVISHEVNGLLTKCGDLEELAQGLRRLVDDAMLRQPLGEAGRLKTLRENRWHDKLSLVEDVYQQLIRGEADTANF